MAKKKVRIERVDVHGYPHNGEGKPHLQFPDPVNGEMIGGQVAFMRMAMRYRHVVGPWARRGGKTKARQFITQNEAAITPGEYYSGICFPDHTTAAKIASDFRKSWGPMVKAYKINDKDQDRWIDLHPQAPPPDMAPPTWFTPPMVDRWVKAQDGERNELYRLYFWGCAHPHYEKVQGFPHHFNRVDWDETQQIHPFAYGIIRPMTRDVRGHEAFTGTPWHTGVGNVQFEKFWDHAGDTEAKGWFRMRVPDGANPHVPAVTADDMKTMSREEIQQTMYAQFLTGEGAVFSNLDNVFILPFIPKGDEALDWIRALVREHAMPSVEWWIHQNGPLERHVYGASIDWARSPKGDYSVMTVFDFSTGNQVALFRWRGEDFTAQMEVVLAIQKRYGASQLHSDANGMGEPMMDFMRRRQALGFVGHKFGRNKAGYVRRAQILLRDGDVQMIDCPAQRKEFKAFSAFESEGLGSEKTIKYCAPPGEHDDLVAAFLHLAPTLTISGRQAPIEPEPEMVPMFDGNGRTTLAQFTEGAKLPWDTQSDDGALSWRSVILPPGY